MANFYQHSNRASAIGALVTSACGLTGAVALAWVYSYGIVYIPFDKAHFILTIVYGAAIGWFVGLGAKLGHVRSNFLAAGFGATCGLVGLYTAWGVDLLARLGFAQAKNPWLAFDPRVLMDYIAFFYNNGFWAMNGTVQKGFILAVCWTLEALVIIGFAALTAYHFIKPCVYCEDCQRWAKKAKKPQIIAPLTAPDAYNRIVAGDLRPLLESGGSDPKSLHHLELSLTACPSCQESTYLTIWNVVTEIKKNKQKAQHRHAIIDRLQINPSHLAVIRQEESKATETGVDL